MTVNNSLLLSQWHPSDSEIGNNGMDESTVG